MRALQMVAWQQGPELRDIPQPQPGPGEVLLEVEGAGACHSDLHVMEWPAGALPYDLPFTLGHETTGRVAALGPGVSGMEEGEPMVVYGPWGCGRCRRCALGEENYCERAAEIRAAGGGLGRDGGMAEYMLVPSTRLLVPLGDLDPVAAAPLTDAGLTPYHAIKRSLPLLEPGSTAVVIGVGGLGHLAVQLLKALSPARVVAVDTVEAKLDQARRIGADAGVLAGEQAADQIRGRTRMGLGAELVLDLVGADPTLALAAQVAKPKGAVTIVGLAGGTLPVAFGQLPLECSVAIPYWGSRSELMEVIALAQAGRIEPEVERFPLEQAHLAYQRMRDGQLRGRAVITLSAS